jgi:hypothetical protein
MVYKKIECHNIFFERKIIIFPIKIEYTINIIYCFRNRSIFKSVHKKINIGTYRNKITKNNNSLRKDKNFLQYPQV